MTLTKNLRKVLKQATQENWSEGLLWYIRANKRAQDITKNNHVSLETAVGVIAALSPQTASYR